MSESFTTCNESYNLGSMNGENHSSYSNVGNITNIHIHNLNNEQSKNILHIGNFSEIEMLKQKIIDLERVISSKDDIIKCKDEVISTLKYLLNK